jgi:hypothetical protein
MATVEKDFPDQPDIQDSELRQRKKHDEATEIHDEKETPKPNFEKMKLPEELSSVDQVKKLVTKEPHKIPTVYEKLVRGILTDRNFLLFTVTWLPLMVMALGSFTGSLLVMVKSSWHFLLGIGIGFHIYQTFKNPNKKPEEKVMEVLRVSSIAPILMCHNFLENVFSHLTILIAFSATPFGLELFFPQKEGKQESLQQELLKLNIAPAVAFVISTGGTGHLLTIYMCAIFAGAYLIVEKAYEPLMKIVKDKLPPVMKGHEALIFIGLEYMVAHAIQWTLHYLVFSSLFTDQNGFFLSFFYSLIGMGILVGGRVLLKMKEDENIKKAKSALLVATAISYVGLLVGYLLKHMWSY